jgi:thiamine biosynthesis lipoprotein
MSPMPAPTIVAPEPVRTEVTERFPCFGTTVTVIASGADVDADRAAIGRARVLAQDLSARLTRFDPASELCRLNADPRRAVPAGPLLRRLASAARWAGEATGGLVDATCLSALEDAGYRGHFEPGAAAGPAWARAAGTPAPLAGAWRTLRVSDAEVIRPAGVRLDSGGLAKGLAADLMARELRDCDAWVVDCAGDLRLGGTADLERPVHVASPGGPEDDPVHTFRLRAAAVATSGTTRRAWAGGHHLIDPRTGAPADTGVVQVTALAPTALLAEVRAKAALLSGPSGAAAFLPDGGVVITGAGAIHLMPGTRRGADR